MKSDRDQTQGISKPAAPENDFKLRVEPFVGTPEEIERQWFEQVYKGRGDSMIQLTWRAILMGSVLGAILSLTNLYIGLKAGWGFGVSVTACILSYAIWESLYRAGIARSRMTILENNCMQSTASAAGYSTGGTLVSAFSAYVLLNGQPLPLGLTLAWVFFVALLGVTMAVPMKRQMINIEQLRFPTGIASAETLQALYSHGAKGMRAAKALGIAGIVAALDKFWAEGFGILSRKFEALKSLESASSATLLSNLSSKVLGKDWIGRTVEFSWDAVFVAAGAITGLRVCMSMLLSGTLKGIIQGGGFRACVQWTLWAGTSCMVTASLLQFAFQWRTALSAFRGLGRKFSKGRQGGPSEMEAIETPGSWVMAGQLVSLVALAWLANYSFGMPVWQSVLAVILSFALAVVACRVTGETDTTPQGAMGKITQLIFGAVNPGNVNVNLFSANITGGTAISAADLLTDLKSGYLLGANPRKQFLAQFAGIFIGTAATCLTYSMLVPNAQALGGKQFPAPAAQTWSAVAQALSKGLSGLEPLKVWLIIGGGIVGLMLAILPMLLPRQQKYFPSAAAVGLAWIFQWYYGVLFFIGALIAWIWERKSKQTAEEFTYSVASGLIAGGSIMGVFLIFGENGPEIISKLFHRN
jgi:putative OPT family oligopeptide transporter